MNSPTRYKLNLRNLRGCVYGTESLAGDGGIATTPSGCPNHQRASLCGQSGSMHGRSTSTKKMPLVARITSVIRVNWINNLSENGSMTPRFSEYLPESEMP